MPNILFLSSDSDFAADLSEQISLYAKDFVILNHDDAGLIDMIILDEQADKLEELRLNHPRTPVILLQKSGDERVGSTALNNVVFKPLSLDKLLNQIKSGINLLENTEDGYLTFNKYIVRPIKKDIYNQRNQEVVKLTEKEVAIIKYLYRCRDRIVTKNELLQEVWGYSPDVSTHTIETHIYRLRQKVEHEDAEAQLILTEDGGYRLKIC